MTIYEEIIAEICKSEMWAISVPGGSIYYVTDKGELVHAPGNSEPEEVVDPSNDELLAHIFDLIRDPDAAIPFTAEKTLPESTFEVLSDVPVIAESMKPGTEPVEIANVLHGLDKDTGAVLVVLTGYKGAGITILTPVADADGNVNVDFVTDLQSYAYAFMQMADKLSREYFDKPVIPDFTHDETDSDSIVPKQRRAEA